MGRATGFLNLMIAAAFVAVSITGCTHASKNDQVAQKQAAAKKEEALKKQQLAQLQAQLKQHKDQEAADQKLIPKLLSESDTALQQAQKYGKFLQSTKDKKAAALLQRKIDDAQGVADARADQLVSTRQDLYRQFDTTSDLQKQISALTGEDKAAQRVIARQPRGNDGDENATDSGSSLRRHHKHSSRLAHDQSGSHM